MGVYLLFCFICEFFRHSDDILRFSVGQTTIGKFSFKTINPGDLNYLFFGLSVRDYYDISGSRIAFVLHIYFCDPLFIAGRG